MSLISLPNEIFSVNDLTRKCCDGTDLLQLRPVTYFVV